MNNKLPVAQGDIKFLVGSREFQIFNIIGWLSYNIFHSFNVSFYSGTLASNFLNFFITTITGIFCGFCVRFLYFKLHWYKSHPIKLIPIACCAAFAFAILNSLLYVVSGFNFSNICNVHFSGFCNDADELSQGVYAMLVWALLYFFLQAERKPSVLKSLTWGDYLKAFACIFLLKEIVFFVDMISKIGSFRRDYLYSEDYFLNNIIQIFFSLFFSLYIFLVRPGEQFLRSRLLPFVPTLLILVFCSSVLNIWTIDVILRSWYLITYTYLPEKGQVISYLLFGSQSAEASSSIFAGTFKEIFRDNLIVSLLFLYVQFSSYWQLKTGETPVGFDIKKTVQFWAYNIGGWFIAGCCLYLSGLLGLDKINQSMPIQFTILFLIIGLFMGVILRSVMRHYQLVNSTLVIFAYKVAVISILLGLLQAFALWFCNYIYIYIALDGVEIKSYEYFVQHSYYFYESVLICASCCFLWALIYEISVSQREKLAFTLKQLQLEKSMKETQLNALAGKIDPHFIFNALNNIRALIKEDAERARESILVLSEILRNPISKNLQDKVSVADELVLIAHYIALSKIQFERRLHYKEEVDPKLKLALVPSMMLQILVENAIKHGISQLAGGGVLQLQIYSLENKLLCRVFNNGELLTNSNTRGFGVGLKNIHERLRLLYGNTATFTLLQLDDGVIAELALPLEYEL